MSQLREVGGDRRVEVQCARQDPCRAEHAEGDSRATGHGESQHAPQESRHIAACVGRERENERRNADGEGTHVSDVARQVWEWNASEHHAERNERRIGGLGEEQAGDTLHVRHDLSAAGDDVGQVRELGVHKHDLCDGFRGGCGVAHRDAKVGFLKGERIVDTVAGHGDRVAALVERLDDGFLLVGQHAAHDVDVFKDRGELVDVLRQFAGVDGARGAVCALSILQIYMP